MLLWTNGKGDIGFGQLETEQGDGDRRINCEYTYTKLCDQDIGDTPEYGDEIKSIPFVAKIILARQNGDICTPLAPATYPQTKGNYFQNTFHGE